MKIFILNGPNLNLLGKREPEIYGHKTLEDIKKQCERAAGKLNLEVDFRQTNHEGELVDWVQEAGEKAKALILNAGAYTHTSIALHDALKSLTIVRIELHLSNVFAREPFRKKSYISPAVDGVICGFGAAGYDLALDAAKRLLDK